MSNSAESTTTTTEQSEQAKLIAAAQRGNVGAYNELVLQHQKYVFNVAVRMLGDTDVAADMTQDAFIRGYKSIAQIKGSNFKAWITRIVSNRCIDEIRRRKRQPQTSIEETTDENESPAWLGTTANNPEAVQQDRDTVQQVAVCLDELPTEQRSILVLRIVQGYDYAEIGRMTELTLGTVKSRISRARARLKACLQRGEPTA